MSKIGMFVRYFYMKSGQETYQETSVLDMTQLINPNYTNFIIVHGFTDGVRPGGNVAYNAQNHQYIIDSFDFFY